MADAQDAKEMPTPSSPPSSSPTEIPMDGNRDDEHYTLTGEKLCKCLDDMLNATANLESRMVALEAKVQAINIALSPLHGDAKIRVESKNSTETLSRILAMSTEEVLQLVLPEQDGPTGDHARS